MAWSEEVILWQKAIDAFSWCARTVYTQLKAPLSDHHPVSIILGTFASIGVILHLSNRIRTENADRANITGVAQTILLQSQQDPPHNER